MARLIPFNRTGIVGIESIEAKIENNTLTYVFESHPYVNTPYNGLLLVHLKNPAPAGATAEMPIFFETSGLLGSRKAVTKAGGEPLVSADVTVPCYNLFFYDFRTGVIEAVAGVFNIA